MSTEAETLAVLRDHDRFLLCSHEFPDGDALGSTGALQLALTALGKDAVSYMSPRDLPLPHEYRFLDLGPIVTELPEDFDERVLVFCDCGNAERSPDIAVFVDGHPAPVLNLDHHHDNSEFGTVNYVLPDASSTAEIVWTLLRGLGVELTPAIADALYVGVVTDTGRFSYENTGAAAHRMAAELHEAGVDAQRVYGQLYENVPPAKLDLLTHALANLQRLDRGRLTLTHLSAADYAATGAEQSYSEGVVDHLRSLSGTVVAALVRDQLARAGTRRVSLRAADERVDVSEIARGYGGGGHRRAAGFTTDLPVTELADRLRAAVAAQLAVPAA